MQIFGFKIGLVSIWVKTMSDKSEHTTTKAIDQWIPIQVIEKPANAGPTTAAVCQTELLQVAALGYAFLGTIRDSSEKMVGPRKARTNPPKKTKK